MQKWHFKTLWFKIHSIHSVDLRLKQLTEVCRGTIHGCPVWVVSLPSTNLIEYHTSKMLDDTTRHMDHMDGDTHLASPWPDTVLFCSSGKKLTNSFDRQKVAGKSTGQAFWYIDGKMRSFLANTANWAMWHQSAWTGLSKQIDRQNRQTDRQTWLNWNEREKVKVMLSFLSLAWKQ